MLLVPDFVFYAFLNAIIMVIVMYGFNLPIVTIAKVSLLSFILMTVRMHLQFKT